MRFFEENMLQHIESGASSFAERDSTFGERALGPDRGARIGASERFNLDCRMLLKLGWGAGQNHICGTVHYFAAKAALLT